nr:putative retrotransposon Ty1-copia subclass protein [Tanacetum cinerariifolium]
MTVGIIENLPLFTPPTANFMIVLSVEDKLNYLEHLIHAASVPPHASQQVAPEALAAHVAWVKGLKEIVGLMLVTMDVEFQRNLENLGAYEMLQELKTLFAQQADPFKIVSRQRASNFVTFTDDFSSYGYVYLLKHKHEVFETFKVFQKEVENQLDRMCLYINAEEHELGDLGEPANYKVALLDPESNKWLNSMNVKMQSMKDNEVWDLVDLPPNGKTFGSKWLFKKKTGMDGDVHTYKAHLMPKGYTQTLGIDYEETFSPFADIRAIPDSRL